MGDRGPSRQMTLADHLFPSQPRSGTSGNSERASSSTNLPYAVRATKKGGVPCVVESRKHHKVVVVSNVEGDASTLLSALQRSLGAGGKICHDNTGTRIEVQGEHHLEKIRTFLLHSGCVVGASRAQKEEAAAVVMAKKSKSQKGATTTKSDAEKSTTKGTSNLGSETFTPKMVKAMKPTEMKAHLSARNLSTQGNKQELIARLLKPMDDPP
eukprot:scaffold42226_cov45-Attheya_sp.AAC.3